MKTLESAKAARRSGVRRVAIEVRAKGATEVAITGSFNRWEAPGVRLSHDGAGLWRTVLPLAPGEYEYRLVVDGTWKDHSEAAKRVPNPFGTENCVLIVT